MERCPAYLTDALGAPPHDGAERKGWDMAAASIEAYRHRVLGLEPPSGAVADGTALEAAIGNEPDDFTASLAWRSVAGSIEPERVLELDHELGISL